MSMAGQLQLTLAGPWQQVLNIILLEANNGERTKAKNSYKA